MHTTKLQRAYDIIAAANSDQTSARTEWSELIARVVDDRREEAARREAARGRWGGFLMIHAVKECFRRKDHRRSKTSMGMVSSILCGSIKLR
jgi:hypothetical protein